MVDEPIEFHADGDHGLPVVHVCPTGRCCEHFVNPRDPGGGRCWLIEYCDVCTLQGRSEARDGAAAHTLVPAPPAGSVCMHDGPKSLHPDGMRYEVRCDACGEGLGDAPMTPDEDRATWYHGGTWMAEQANAEYVREAAARGEGCSHVIEALRRGNEVLDWCAHCGYAQWQNPG